MAKFCKFCGAPLEEGQVCTCQSSQTAPVTTSNSNILVDTLKTYFQAPKATATAVAQNKQGTAVAGIFAGVNFLAVFFFLWRIIGAFIEKSASLSEVDIEDLVKEADLVYPIFPMLIAGLAITILGIAITALVVFVVGKINQQEVNVKEQILIASVHTLIPTAVLIVCTLLSLLAWWFLLVALTVNLVLWFVNIQNALDQGDDSGKSALIRIGAIVLAMVIVVGLSSVLANWSIGEVEMDGDTMNEQIEESRESAEDHNYSYSNKSVLHQIFDTLLVIEN